MSTSNRISSFTRLIGVAGVNQRENLAARRAGIVLEIPMLIASLWILLNWLGKNESQSYDIYDIYLWGFFITETVVLALLVSDTKHYLISNWLNLIIIITGIPMLLGWPTHLGALRLLRLIIVFALLMHISGRVRKMLSSNELAATVLASLIVIVMSGILMSALDPSIKSPADGIWWAWVTITTVGYGDIVPQSNVGRAFASVIILLGLGLFAALTASFAAFFIAQNEEKIISSEETVHKRLSAIEKQLTQFEEKLDLLLHRGEQESPNEK